METRQDREWRRQIGRRSRIEKKRAPVVAERHSWSEAMNDLLSRRSLLALGAGAVVLSACRRSESCSPDPPPSGRASAKSCGLTAANIEGPYYRAGAPFRRQLADASTPGIPLLLTGSVLSLDCRSRLSGAVIDLWQANSDGHYDNDGSHDAPADVFRLRGKVRADASGRFSFHTVLPGRYLNGSTYRPRHLHVKLRAAGHRPLTTQLYFPGDPYNDSDPFIVKSLILDVQQAKESIHGHYDFVLRPT